MIGIISVSMDFDETQYSNKQYIYRNNIKELYKLYNQSGNYIHTLPIDILKIIIDQIKYKIHETRILDSGQDLHDYIDKRKNKQIYSIQLSYNIPDEYIKEKLQTYHVNAIEFFVKYYKPYSIKIIKSSMYDLSDNEGLYFSRSYPNECYIGAYNEYVYDQIKITPLFKIKS